MFQEILKHQWVIITLFGGVAFVLFFFLYYIDLWKPRKMKESNPEEYETDYLSANEAIPWIIKVLILVVVIFMIIYTIIAIYQPKNW